MQQATDWIDLSGKVAHVTGGAKGIGRSISQALAMAGATTSTGISETLFAPNGPVGSSVVTRMALTAGVSMAPNRPPQRSMAPPCCWTSRIVPR